MEISTTSARARRLGARTRKGVLVVHIAAAGAWIGIDLVMGILVFTPFLTDDGQTVALAYQTLEIVAIGPLLATGILTMASGIVLGLGSKYGLVRYWWVATKLALNLVLCALVPAGLRPAVEEAARYGKELAAGSVPTEIQSDLLFPPVVSVAALLFAVSLSIFKPWGRIRRDRTRAVSDNPITTTPAESLVS